jgi:hypothetical protein
LNLSEDNPEGCANIMRLLGCSLVLTLSGLGLLIWWVWTTFFV